MTLTIAALQIESLGRATDGLSWQSSTNHSARPFLDEMSRSAEGVSCNVTPKADSRYGRNYQPTFRRLK